MNKVYGFGIIGAGVIFDDHARALETLKDRARLIGLSDLDETKLGQASDRYFVPYTYTNYRDLLDRDDIDVIVVATPPSTHEQLVIEALEAGKHVICEKPLAHTLESADRILEEIAKYPGKLTVCYQTRFMPEIQRIIWLRDNGWLGDLKCGNFQETTLFTHAAALDWYGRWEVAGGGVVITQFIHRLDLMIHLFGRPVAVYAEMDTLQQNIESEDTFAATVRFKSGAIVSCYSTLNAHRIESHVNVIGDRASAHLPWSVCASDGKHLRHLMRALNQTQSIPEAPRQSLRALVVQMIKNQLSRFNLLVRVMRKVLSRLGIQLQTTGPPPLHRPLIAAFLDALQSDGEVPVSAEEARMSLELCTAIYTSALSGEVVSLPLEKSSLCYKGITTNVYRERYKV